MSDHAFFHSGLAVASATSGVPAGSLDNGRYLFRTPLGKGTFGNIGGFYDQQLQREVAIKVCHDERCDLRTAQAALANERRVHEMLGVHPHLIELYGVIRDSEDPDRPLALVMEYAPHGTLRDWLVFYRDDHSYRLRYGPQLIAQVCAVITHIHGRGIVHGDIKPEQFLMTGPRHVKLTDLGSCWAPRMLPGPETLSSRPLIPGTAPYAAPELLQAGHGGPIDHRSDIYSVGALAYEMLHPRCVPPAYENTSATHNPLAALAGVSRPIADAVSRCLERI
ncbi:MAG: serine/threonine protein kinase [Candidatus Hydrogenedentes bacterium]|nr:serine/threonine protein kinase [Candidatus Hydrogenedentota bacterium]